MQRLLLSLFFLSCGLNSGSAEIFTHGKYSLIRTPKSVYSSVRSFQCENDDDCQTFILGSKCINKNCECAEDEVLSGDASKCLKQANEFGSPCKENIQCSSLLSTGGICNENNKCSCKIGYHYLRGVCWKNIGLKEKCVTNEQCFSSYEYVGLKCENVCKCKEKYYDRLGSGCRREREPGESCNLDEDCKGTSCENMICGGSKSVAEKSNSFPNITVTQTWEKVNCPKGMFELNGKCVLELGGECKKDSECSHISDSVCLDNQICACEPVRFVASENNRKCLKVAKGKTDAIDKTSCHESDSQCGVFGSNSYCRNTRCACKVGTYFEVKQQFCWTIKLLQEDCKDDRDCHPSVTHSQCATTKSGQKCVCQKGYHQKDLQCLPDALKVGDPCEKDEECLFPNSFCNANKVCSCKKNHYLEDGKCQPGVGSKTCVKNEDCVTFKNTECKIGDIPLKQCLCKGNHTNSEDYKYCLQEANIKEACEESFQCVFHLGSLGECKNKTCECREGAHYSYGKCHKSKFVGESCSKRQDCFPGNDINSAICQKGLCKCNYGYELDETKACVRTNTATSIKSYSMLLTSSLFFLAIR